MKKPTLVALAVFGALALAWGLTREREVSAGIHRLTFAPVTVEQLTSVEVGNVLLTATADAGWTVAATDKKEQTYAAGDGQVRALLTDLAGLKASDFVTEKPERQAELEVDAAKGVVVKARTATGVVRDVVVGKASKSGGTYLRAAGSNEVFSATGGLGFQVHRALKDWRDQRIPTIAVAEVKSVQVTPASGMGFTLVKNETAWKLESPPAGFRFDAEAAQRLVNTVSSLTAQDFFEGAPSDALGATITLTASSGATKVLHLGPKRPDGTTALKIDGEAQGWMLPGWQAEALSHDLEGLRDLRVLPIEPTEVQKVTLTAAKGAKVVVTRDASSWKLVEPKTAPAGFDFDPAQVDAQLRGLASVRATRVADVPAAKAGLGNATVELGLKGGSTVGLRFGSTTGSNELYAKGSDEHVLVVAAAQKTRFDQGLDLFKRPPAPPPGGGMRGLDQLPPDVRAKLEAQLRAQGAH